MTSNPNSPTKWVTFHDLMDDAMEGGKLASIKRRMSAFAVINSYPSSVSSNNSNCSLDTAAEEEGGERKIHPQRPLLDFSQSFGGYDENNITTISQPCTRTRRSSTLPSLYVSTEVSSKKKLSETSSVEEEDEECEEKQHDGKFNVSHGSSGYSSCEDHNNQDKYSVLKGLKAAGNKGWSGKVRGNGPFGWSEQVMGDTEQQQPQTRPNQLGVLVQEEPWYKGHPALRNATWDKSPNRSFIRNFP